MLSEQTHFQKWPWPRDLSLGELQLPLNSVDLAAPIEEWKDLAPVDDGSNQYLGDLCLSLRYVPSSGKLTGTYTYAPPGPQGGFYFVKLRFN